MDEVEALELARLRVRNSRLNDFSEPRNFGVPVVGGETASELTQQKRVYEVFSARTYKSSSFT